MSSGLLDFPTHEVLAQRAITYPLVPTWESRPDPISPRVLELQLDRTRYPSVVCEVRIDVRWFVGGDYTVHYLEIREEETWQCQWDRDPKPEAPRSKVDPDPIVFESHVSGLPKLAQFVDYCFPVAELNSLCHR